MQPDPEAAIDCMSNAVESLVRCSRLKDPVIRSNCVVGTLKALRRCMKHAGYSSAAIAKLNAAMKASLEQLEE